ncbi:MAG: hypothetical protein DRN19_02310 [Thermoplasmata archaeon]|nr:MAG: hypothetical protein FE042_02440 [Thermoplasmata archaeon]RLF51698.1 MAG: hypothetical protein DRN19_02310 [Thermoplasmata archaeon]
MPARSTSSPRESNRSKKKRHRYIGFVVVEPESGIDREKLKAGLRYHCRKLFGDSWEEVGLRLTRFNGKEGMVHCYHIYKDKVINLLNSMEKIFNQRVNIKTIGTSGTIKSLNRKFFGGRLRKEHDPDYMKRFGRG